MAPNVWNNIKGSGNDFQPISSSVGIVPPQPQSAPPQSLQTMDGQALLGARSHPAKHNAPSIFTFPTSTSIGQSSCEQKLNQKPRKLNQLLTQESSDNFDNKMDDMFGKHNLMKSPSHSEQHSPQPGPGQSPLERPQSTSNEDVDPHSNKQFVKKKKEENTILKKLLSQEENDDTHVSSRILTNELMDSPPASPTQSLTDMAPNEAEPKQSHNLLLKVRIFLFNM